MGGDPHGRRHGWERKTGAWEGPRCRSDAPPADGQIELSPAGSRPSQPPGAPTRTHICAASRDHGRPARMPPAGARAPSRRHLQGQPELKQRHRWSPPDPSGALSSPARIRPDIGAPPLGAWGSPVAARILGIPARPPGDEADAVVWISCSPMPSPWTCPLGVWGER
jgi:hypothetical protein